MSGHSASITVPAERAAALAAVHAIENGEKWDLESLAGSNWLFAGSRNNWLEFQVRCLINAFGQKGLVYLTRPFEPTGRPRHGCVPTALIDHALDEAVRGVRQLIATLQQNPARAAGVMELVEAIDELIGELENPPASLAEAIERFKFKRHADEGDDIPTLVAFLYAHLAVLEFAKKNSLCAVYAVWLY